MTAFDEQEMRVVGALILVPERLPECQEVLCEGDFSSQGARLVWRALEDLDRAGTLIDLASVLEELGVGGSLPAIGGEEAVAEACSSVSSAAHLLHDVGVVARRSALGRLAKEAQALAAACAEVRPNHAEETDAFLEDAQTRIWRASQPIRKATAIEPLAKVSGPTLERLMAAKTGDPHGMQTGLEDLDAMLLGLHAGQMVTVGARPSVGKTAVALQVALNMASAGHRCLFVSAEQSAEQIAMRALSNLAGVDSRWMRQPGGLQGQDRDTLEEAQAALDQMPLAITAPLDPTVTSVRSAVRRYSPEAVFVDYLQFLRDPGHPSRFEEVSAISRYLKRTAREFNCLLFTMAQLGREAEREQPSLRHLKESGQIEQDSDVVWLLSRDQTEMTCTVAKNREGATGRVRLFYRGACFQVKNCTPLAEAIG